MLLWQGHRKELSGGFARTTNNRMELLAAIKGLEALKAGQRVVLYSDSRYVVQAVNAGWLQRWLRTGFKGKKNADLWRRFWRCYQQHQVRLHWVKGHAGQLENERCDALAVQAAQQAATQVDSGYTG